jgi:hypothetical protein
MPWALFLFGTLAIFKEFYLNTNKGESKMERKDVKLAGFAQGNGKVIHVVVVNPIAGNITLCEAKATQPENDKNIEMVSCKKCRRLKFFHNVWIQNEIEPNVWIQNEIEPKEKSEPPIEVHYENKEAEEKETKKNIETIKKISNKQKTQKQKKEEEKNNYQFIKEKSGNKWNIKHQRSGNVFFEGVEESAIDLCIKKLNALETTWNGQGTPGSKYFSIIREAFKLGCMECGIDYPKCLDEIKEPEKKEETKPPKETKARKPKHYALPRRKKKEDHKEDEKLKEAFGVTEPTKIKRRKPKEIKLRRRDENIFRKSSPKQTIIETMKTEITKEEILKVVSEKHKIRMEALSVLFSTTVRQAVRVKRRRIQIILQGEDTKGSQDTYKIIS